MLLKSLYFIHIVLHNTNRDSVHLGVFIRLPNRSSKKSKYPSKRILVSIQYTQNLYRYLAIGNVLVRSNVGVLRTSEGRKCRVISASLDNTFSLVRKNAGQSLTSLAPQTTAANGADDKQYGWRKSRPTTVYKM